MSDADIAGAFAEVYEFMSKMQEKMNDIIEKHNNASGELGSFVAAMLHALCEKGIVTDDELKKQAAKYHAKIDQMRAELRDNKEDQ